MPREAYRWPTFANQTRKECLERLKESAARVRRAIEAVEQQRAPEVVNADLWPVANAIADMRRLLTEIGQGAPDDLQHALDVLRNLRHAGAIEANTIDRIDELLERYT